MKEIIMIGFPNTVTDSEKSFYQKKDGYTFGVFTQNGEMAEVNWFEINKDGEKVAEIKQSVCDIYYG